MNGCVRYTLATVSIIHGGPKRDKLIAKEIRHKNDQSVDPVTTFQKIEDPMGHGTTPWQYIPAMKKHRHLGSSMIK